jgi:polyferredoxin
VVLALSLFVSASMPTRADSAGDLYPQVQGYFPKADTLTPFEGDPPAARVYAGEQLLGYVFLTDQVVPIPAYSGKPIKTLVGFNLQGELRGVRILAHEEPILVVGVTEDDLAEYIDQYRGKNVTDRVKIGGSQRDGYVTVDGISGATITVMVLNRSIMASAKKVAAARGLIREKGGGTTASESTASSAEPDPMLEPIWKYAWRQKSVRIGVLVTSLGFLTLILVFQDWLARHPSLLIYVRDGFLVFTLLFIGWYGLAQLSVVNVLTFVHALTQGFTWDTFLVDPMMFILWAFVAVTIVLWGRGVYCGWLCPFGALQELTYQLAKKLRLPSVEFPQVVHERLWAIKYITLIVLFGLSMESLETAVRYAEVEPFKTAITLRFQREWWFVLFAGGLVLVSAFNRKFYCKYLCPLGAALTFPGRFRIFDWLRRRKECGRPCQTCAGECEVRAISPIGEINENECHYCLDCQVTYWNTYKCPPLVDKRKRWERHAKKAGSVPSGVAVPSGGGRADVVVSPPTARKGGV